MNQNEKRNYLISELLKEQPQYQTIEIPQEIPEQKKLLRALMNVRMPMQISSDFLDIQDSYLKEVNTEKGIVKISDLEPIQKGIYLWQGDITRLAADAIVNAANSSKTGCYRSCLELAEENQCQSIAFCCISTGVFCFPNEKAAEIAVQTVNEYREQTKTDMAVIFNVFQNQDYDIYRELLG